jgi:NTP pyrophosphatase (non-canonical NTP hydrolase)
MNLAEFQKLMRDLYFKNDQTRGIHRTALWLVEEMGELARELKKDPDQMNRTQIEEEMADLYAWVASLANLLDIDLEKALESKYPAKCPKCNHAPCQCNRNLP